MDELLLIKEAKEVVTYLKASELAANISKKILQECETRWNSLHTMLTSVLGMYDEGTLRLPRNRAIRLRPRAALSRENDFNMCWTQSHRKKILNRVL